MKCETELNFIKKLFNNFGLSFYLFQEPFDSVFPPPDFGLRKLLNPDFDYTAIFRQLPEICKPNVMYRIQDLSLCNYLFFRVPDDEVMTFVMLGPYTLIPFSQETLLADLQKSSLSPELFPQIEKYHREIPFISDESLLQTLLYTLGEIMWGGIDNFTIQDYEDFSQESFSYPAHQGNTAKQEKPFVSINVLEKRYSDENALIQAVASGQIQKAELYGHALMLRQWEERVTDPLRNKKNYSIILNTLLRKAAEQGSVHPLHIDSLSSKFARKIELCASPKALDSLTREMIHKYCLLVQNHSLKGYSLLVQKVLTNIDSDLTADLSLYAQAKLLNVNSSYLSTLFKKETGVTLTEYVNKKRIKHAVFLLNTTNMQIQTIAQCCGIPDVNYFIKTFKKHIGKTPKEYRDYITNYNGTHMNGLSL